VPSLAASSASWVLSDRHHGFGDERGRTHHLTETCQQQGVRGGGADQARMATTHHGLGQPVTDGGGEQPQ
jgi:hypothetical protein